MRSAVGTAEAVAAGRRGKAFRAADVGCRPEHHLCRVLPAEASRRESGPILYCSFRSAVGFTGSRNRIGQLHDAVLRNHRDLLTLPPAVKQMADAILATIREWRRWPVGFPIARGIYLNQPPVADASRRLDWRNLINRNV